MKTTINKSEFRQAFSNHGREEQFSYEALGLIFDYLETLEEDTGEEIEMDVIAICCEYAEADAQTIADDYGIDLEDCETDEEIEEAVLDYLNDNTQVIGQTATGIVYAQF